MVLMYFIRARKGQRMGECHHLTDEDTKAQQGQKTCSRSLHQEGNKSPAFQCLGPSPPDRQLLDESPLPLRGSCPSLSHPCRLAPNRWVTVLLGPPHCPLCLPSYSPSSLNPSLSSKHRDHEQAAGVSGPWLPTCNLASDNPCPSLPCTCSVGTRPGLGALPLRSSSSKEHMGAGRRALCTL